MSLDSSSSVDSPFLPWDTLNEIMAQDFRTWLRLAQTCRELYVYHEKHQDKFAQFMQPYRVGREESDDVEEDDDTEYKLSPDFVLHSWGDRPGRIHAGSIFWYRRGKYHRDGAPAIIHSTKQIWCQYGQVHRVDGPAIIYADGHEEWWQYDGVHRDGDMPALIHPNGGKAWYQRNRLHRDGDMPASVSHTGDLEWWRRGEKYNPWGPLD